MATNWVFTVLFAAGAVLAQDASQTGAAAL